MNHFRVLLLTAVNPEARALARAFSLRRGPESPAGLQWWVNDEMALGVVGVRAGKLDEVAQMAASFDGVIMAGVAGALAPTLSVGDVVVDARGAGGGFPGIEGAHLGRVHTSGEIVGTSAAKRSLFESNGCLAVDMETEIAARFAAKRGAAFLAVRGISDTAAEPLDSSLLTLVDANGRPKMGRAMGMLCRHPGKLPAMLRLGRATNLAMASVARVVGKIVASGWPRSTADRRE